MYFPIEALAISQFQVKQPVQKRFDPGLRIQIDPEPILPCAFVSVRGPRQMGELFVNTLLSGLIL